MFASRAMERGEVASSPPRPRSGARAGGVTREARAILSARHPSHDICSLAERSPVVNSASWRLKDAHRARTALGPLMRISFFETRTSSMSSRRKVVARGSGRLRGGIGALAGVPLQTQPRFDPD
jgi:hypothetical protein